MKDWPDIDSFRERTNRCSRVCDTIEKSIRFCGFRPQSCHAERMLRIELRQELCCGIELFDRQNKSVQHPHLGRTHILRLVPQSGLERQTARREHSRIINYLIKKSAERSRNSHE